MWPEEREMHVLLHTIRHRIEGEGPWLIQAEDCRHNAMMVSLTSLHIHTFPTGKWHTLVQIIDVHTCTCVSVMHCYRNHWRVCLRLSVFDSVPLCLSQKIDPLMCSGNVWKPAVFPLGGKQGGLDITAYHNTQWNHGTVTKDQRIK